MEVYRFYVAGEAVEGGQRFAVHFPYDGSMVAQVCQPQEGDYERALAAAVAAHEDGPQPAHVRVAVLERAASLIESRARELAETITLEAGKVIRDAEVEVSRAANTLRLSADALRNLDQRVVRCDLAQGTHGRFGILMRFPVGVLFAITPFNFPLNLVCHKLGPAIAAGCPVVLKPSRKTPLSALKLAEILYEAGLDRRFLSVLPSTAELAERYVGDGRFAALSFTGSSAVGWHLKSRFSGRRVTLECGGNAAAIVCADCDIEQAVARCAVAPFANAGQVCISLQRLLVERQIYDAFLERLLEKVRRLRVGDPRNAETNVGPMIDDASVKKAREWVEEALERGAKALTPYKVEGRLFAPLVLEDVAHDCRAWKDEIFAPVVCVEAFDDFAEAVRLVDESRYGLQAGIFTRDMRRILYAYRRINVGALLVNEVPTWRQDQMPYGGNKESGLGREGPLYALEELTEPRLLIINA
ncbi:MAG: aldehyde dehydrogenase [Planctomycetota bacterium]|nr:MAG: aldehyde dehydrogenase [Planctomycetota bacterium]